MDEKYLMIDSTIFLYTKWETQNMTNHCNNYFIRLFGSFLDKNSLELAWYLSFDELDRVFSVFTENTINFISADKYLNLEIIFLPISKNSWINFNFKKKLIELLSRENLPDFSNFINVASLIIQKKQQEFHKRYEISSNEYIYKNQLNKFLFGAKTALFLDQQEFFPLIYINNCVFNGIPRNYSVKSFFKNSILSEFKITSNHSNQNIKPFFLS